MFKTPILLIVFNRSRETRLVFEAIRKIQPSILFIAGDGPRAGIKSDIIYCKEVKQIVGKIDWVCEIHMLFQKSNLGCGLGPVSAINWFFENVEEGIILEDDCLPNSDFFRFCSELLELYKKNEKIMHISGDNFQYGLKRGKYSYYFSEYTHNWGWATWKRAWKYNDYYCLPEKERRDVWDRQWMISVKKNHGLAILPNVNLVSNIGFGKAATHTKTNAVYAKLPRKRLKFPLFHPEIIKINKIADSYTAVHHFGYKKSNILNNYLLVPIIKLKNLSRYVGIVLNNQASKITFNILEISNSLKLFRLYNTFNNYSMIPKNIFLGNLKLVHQFRSVKGNVVECGVWKGGMISAIAKLLGNSREYILFDSFEGLPPVQKIDGISALRWQMDKSSPLYFDNCKTEEIYAREAMVISGITNYKIIKGWFSNTLSKVKFNHDIAILRLDADWFDPTYECLSVLYNQVVKGGIIIVDDYYTWDGCARAVHEFLAKQKDISRIFRSSEGVCYIIKN